METTTVHESGLVTPDEAPRSRCPRHAKPQRAGDQPMGRWISAEAFWGEPFRVFFPLAIVAGVCGVMVWPLVLWGWIEASPVLVHTRLMSLGFLGGFVIGFVGTSLPRLLEGPAFSIRETAPLVGMHFLVCGLYLFGEIPRGDAIMLLNLFLLAGLLGRRIRRRRQLPAPSFLMLIPAWLTVVIGLGCALLQWHYSWGFEWDLPIRLMIYHGFALLCLLSAGGFLLPRFLGLGLRRRYRADGVVSSEWKRSALVALLVGFGVPCTFTLDAAGYTGVGSTLRTVLVVVYLAWEMPIERMRFSRIGVDWILVLGVLSLPVGILLAGWLPLYRVGLSHVEMAMGFGLITIGVASRVVLGHTGNRALLARFHPWLTISALLMILGIGSRITGDLMPRLMISHYNYGALCWSLGALIWGGCVLRHVLKPDPEL